VNIGDGGFFGLGLGFSSFVTILPLFVSTMTNNALLIGLIPAIHNVGWQLPQLFTAYSTSRQNRYLAMVNRFTVHERLPFLFLAVVAWFSPKIGAQTTLILTFLLLIWQGLGGGFTATAWQTMIGKIFPLISAVLSMGLNLPRQICSPASQRLLAGLILERVFMPMISRFVSW